MRLFPLFLLVVVPFRMQVGASYAACVRPMEEVNCDPHLTRASDVVDKIAGGHVAEPGSTPWLVSLMDTQYEDPVPFCGGTLISHSWVLTSASCVTSYEDHHDQIKVVLGEYDLTQTEGYEKHRWVTHIALHPDFDYYTHHADVALLKLSILVFYNERINVLSLPDWKSPHDHKPDTGNDDNLYTIAGWGRKGESGEYSDVVREAQVTLLPRQECNEIYPDFTDTMICAGNLTHGGLDSCQGDMGGALASSDGFIKGVSSWSVGCGRPGYPGVYTDVQRVKEWICSETDWMANKPTDRLLGCGYEQNDAEEMADDAVLGQ